MTQATTEGAIYAAVIQTIKTGLAVFNLSGVTVKQAYQPKIAGRPNGPAVLVSNVKSKRYGFLKRADVWQPDADPPFMQHSEIQSMQTSLQINGYSPLLAPTTTYPNGSPPPYSAADLTNMAAATLQSDAGVALLRTVGLGIERISDIRQPYFKNDQDDFEASPSFDLILDWTWVIVGQQPIITKIVDRILAV